MRDHSPWIHGEPRPCEGGGRPPCDVLGVHEFVLRHRSEACERVRVSTRAAMQTQDTDPRARLGRG